MLAMRATHGVVMLHQALARSHLCNVVHIARRAGYLQLLERCGVYHISTVQVSARGVL